MKLIFSSYLGDCSYSFQGSSELISITVTFSLFACRMELQERIPLRNSQEFSAITVTWSNGFRIENWWFRKEWYFSSASPKVSHLFVDSPARTLIFAALSPFLVAVFQPWIARTPFSAIPWYSPRREVSAHVAGLALNVSRALGAQRTRPYQKRCGASSRSVLLLP